MDSTNTAEANRIRTSAQMRRTQLQIERNELVKNNQSTGDLDQRIDQLTTSMKDIDNMLGNENIEFRYGQTTGGGYIDLDNLASDGVVTMYVDNTMDMKIHESRHGGDVARGTLTAGSVYNDAHDAATPQNPVYQTMYDAKGEITTDVSKAVKVEWSVKTIQDKDKVIQTLP